MVPLPLILYELGAKLDTLDAKTAVVYLFIVVYVSKWESSFRAPLREADSSGWMGNSLLVPRFFEIITDKNIITLGVRK